MPLFTCPELDAWANALAGEAQDLTPLYDGIGDKLRAAWRENFDVGGRPAWTPLQPSTLASKQAKGLPANILIGSGDLRDSLCEASHPLHVHRVSKAGLEEGTSNPIAVYQDGGTKPHPITAKNKSALPFVGVGGVRVFRRAVQHPGLPARPLLTLGSEDESALVDACADYVMEGGRPT